MGAFGAYRRLDGGFDGRIVADEPLARHTTYRIGGPADLYIEVDSLAGLRQVISVLKDEGVEWTVLGKGSNILAADAGYRGAIIVLGRTFRTHSVIEDERIVAGAGAILATIVRDVFNKGLAGLELAVGVPGTLGGALAMNAGTSEVGIGSVVESVTYLTPEGELKRLGGSEIEWTYRASSLRGAGVILESSLKLVQSDVAEVRRRMEAILRRRRNSQPLSIPSAGSTFRNPPGDSAGRLIEAVGLKGERVGGAQISEKHANFIVNRMGASAEDVVSLITLARNRVKEEHGIELRPEVRFLGTFES